MSEIILLNILTCPACNHEMEVIMPVNSVQLIYECDRCYTLIRPKNTDCCVFCSYGTILCPTHQLTVNGK